MPWTLDSAEERAAEAPRSFFIPPAEIRRGLVKGDVVKLIFRLEREDGEAAVERMWVEVVATDPYVGVLDNDPKLERVVEHGERVGFGPEHVCGYMYGPGQLGYPADAEVAISPAILERDVPPDHLHLDPEGRWYALVEFARPEHTWTLGYLTDKFPETASAFREGYRREGLLRRPPRNAWWRRDGGAYVREQR